MPTTSPPRPRVIALDVNETLTDMTPLATRLEEVGAPGALLATWFAGTLRDGIALAAAGGYAPFSHIATAVLRSLLSQHPGLSLDIDDAVAHVLDGMSQLPLHPDVALGVRALREAGLRVIALTNGSADIATTVLERGGVASDLDHVLSVDAVERWKPAPEPYRYAATACGVEPAEVLLAAVHPWDVDGALRAGLRSAWIDRSGAPYPPPFRAPDVRAGSLPELARALTEAT